jgi:hypothetical protein
MLSLEEKVSVRHHLGFPNCVMIETFILGVPSAREPLFMLEGAMDSINPAAEPRVRRAIARLDRTDERIEEASDAVEVASADEVEFRENALEILRKYYARWQGELCNLLGIPCPNPYDAREYLAPAGLNITVRHG